MIVYLDTSAFVPLLVTEPSSPACRRVWDDAEVVVSNRLLFVEAAAALAQAHRLGRLDENQHGRCLDLLSLLWPQIDVIELDGALTMRAASIAHECALRGYDAVHCASAVELEDDDLVAATGDRQLLAAWHSLGVATFDTLA